MRQRRSAGGTWRALAVAVLAALALGLGAESADAGSVSYQEGDGKGFVSVTDDAWLNQATPDTNDGVSNKCVVGLSPHQHCVLKFPSIFGDGPDQIPRGSKILNATLSLFLSNTGTTCPTVYQLTEGWMEAEVTWNSRAAAVGWTSPGAEGMGSHEPVAEGVLPCAAPVGLKALDVTGSVQRWSGGQANEGWVIVNANDNDDIDISSSETPVLGERPLLTVTFSPAVFYSVGTDLGDLRSGLPTISVSGGVATLSTAQTRDVGVGDEIDYDSPSQLLYISSAISPTQFEVQTAGGSVPGPFGPKPVNEIRRAFHSIDAAVAGSRDALHLNTSDLVGTSRKLHWVLYDDGPFDLFGTASITGYTTSPDYNITLTVAGAPQVANGNSQRHAGLAGTGARLVMQASGQRALDVDVPYTRIEWLEIDGSNLPTAGGIQVKPNGHEVLLRNLIIHNTRGDSLTGSAVAVATGADDVEVRNLVAYDFGGDGVFMEGSYGKVANSTFYLGRTGGASSSVRTGGTGSTSGYNVLAVGPGTTFREATAGSVTLHHCISTDTSACDLDVSGFCRTNVSPASEFAFAAAPGDLHLRPGAVARDFGFALSGIVDDDIDGQPRPLGLAWDVGADEAPVFSGTTRYRSIGTAADLVDQGSITVTAGSATVTKVGGLGWLTENRGRGDVLVVGLGPEIYTIRDVVSDDELTLASPATAAYTGGTYTIARQFATLQAWEDCISNGGSCSFFPTAAGDLVGDDRSEVGIAYEDSVFALVSDVVFEGATTDALHTITLTADGRNRHNGVSGSGVIVDGQDTGNGIVVRDDHVTIEWLEIIRVRGASNVASILVEGDGQTGLLFQNLLIHDFDDSGGVAGISLSNSGAGNRNVTIRNTMIWDGDEEGIQGGRSSDVVVVENCSIDDMKFAGAAGIDAAEGVVTVVNTIVTRSGTDYQPDLGSFSPASTHNVSSDGTAPGPNALTLGAGAVFVNPGVDLHLNPSANPALDSGVDLFPTSGFQDDVDGDLRPVGGVWDRGADEASSSTVDLALTKDDGQPSAVPGTAISYTITVTNNGPDPVTRVFVTDPVPAAILGSWFSTSNGTYNSGTGEWLFAAPLFVGQSTTLFLNGTIDPAATGSLSNTATVSPPPGLTDSVTSNDFDSDLDPLTPEADLEITKTAGIDPVEVGGLLTYTLSVVNNGPSDATGVTVTDVVPLELEYQSASPSQGGCGYTAATRTLGCNLGPIAASGSASIALVVRATAVGAVSNTADVAGNEPDPVPGNNSATEVTTVESAAVGVRFFTVTSTSEKNVLEWLNPAGAAYQSTEVVYRTDRFPNAPGEAGTTSIYTGGSAGAKDRWEHVTGGGTNGQTFYYAAFVHRSATPFVSTGRFCTGRPFDTSGRVKWAFSTGAFSITAPTVSAAAIVAPANDRAVYAMERGPLGGEWPTSWEPAQLGGVVQSRSPIIPLPVNGANPVVYLGAQDGSVYVVNGTLGGAAAFPWAPASIAGKVQAAPAGVFSAWTGAHDYLLVGSRDDGADNRMVVLNPDVPGNELGSFDNGGLTNAIGIISGMATIDYATSRVYFASHESPTGSNSTLWCLQMGPPGPVLSLVWQRALQDIDSSPVLYNGRVYVGSKDAGGTVYSINAATGAMGDDRVFVHGDGQVKGFVWPDRSSEDLYFATTSRVWGISDTGAATMVDKFSPPGGITLGGGSATPSTVLFVPGSHYLYVGGSDGQLHEIDVLPATPTQSSLPLGDGLALVGAPSLDWFHGLVHVGTEAGVFYAVEVSPP